MTVKPNQALKLTRLSRCLLGEPDSGESPSRGAGFRRRREVQGNCPSPAAQLSAGVRLPHANPRFRPIRWG